MNRSVQRAQVVGSVIGNIKEVVAKSGVNRESLASVLRLVDGLAAHGVDEAQLLALKSNRHTMNLIAGSTRSARTLMLKGSKLVKKVPGRGGWELRLVVQGGLRILDKIEAMNFDTLRQRPKLGLWDVVVMGWRALLM